jgi:phage FluMu gp28-like protein
LTAPEKERLAYGLHAAFSDNTLRIPVDEKLRADLRGIKKEITPSEHIRFIGETNDSHCDRFWAKALRQEATRHTCEVGAEVGW